MATISREAAEKLAKGGGRFYAVVRYQNRIRIDEGADPLNPDAENSGLDYAVCYKKRHYEALLNSPVVGGVDILRASKGYYNDRAEKNVGYPEDSDEVPWAEILAAYPDLFAPVSKTEVKKRKASGRKKKIPLISL